MCNRAFPFCDHGRTDIAAWSPHKWIIIGVPIAGESRGKIGLPFLRLENDHGDFTTAIATAEIPTRKTQSDPIYSAATATRTASKLLPVHAHHLTWRPLVTEIAGIFFSARKSRAARSSDSPTGEKRVSISLLSRSDRYWTIHACTSFCRSFFSIGMRD